MPTPMTMPNLSKRITLFSLLLGADLGALCVALGLESGSVALAKLAEEMTVNVVPPNFTR